MKKIKWLLLLSLPALFMYCARQNEISPARGSVQFSMSQANAATKGKVKSVQAPTGILLSITDANGVSVEQDRRIMFFTFPGGISSESMSLKPGQYKLTKFLVLDSYGAVIYAAPLTGSAQAKYVSTPLSLAFSISDKMAITVTPEVLAVDDPTQPADFGYTWFLLR